jgi:hypothetical protein
MPLPLPVRIRRSKKCPRCGLRYPSDFATCTHCEGLTDEQVRAIKAKHKRQMIANDQLGRLLLYIAGLILIGIVILALQ